MKSIGIILVLIATISSQTNTFPTTGNVGIGTTSAGALLHMKSSVPVLIMQDNNSSGSSQAGFISFQDNLSSEKGWVGFGSSGDTHLSLSNNYTDGKIQFRTSSSTRMVVDSNGKVGIGNTSPSEALDVNGIIQASSELRSISSNPGFLFDETDENDKNWHLQVNSGDFKIFEVNDARTNWQHYFTIQNSSGNVGIGTSSPNYTLDVAGQLMVRDGVLRTGDGTAMLASYASWLNVKAEKVGKGINFFTGGNYSRMVIDANGNVGIGTGAPGSVFNTNQSSWPTFNSNDKILTIATSGNQRGFLEFRKSVSSLNEGSKIGGMFFTNSDGQADAHRQVGGIWAERTELAGNLAGSRLVFMTKIDGGGTQNKMSFDETGKLTVNGEITTKKVKITNSGPWPDFVFADDYDLQSLESTETFIKENKHLPNIPSEAEVKKNGVDVGDMQVKLLQKIEELTLHMISQNKKLEQIEKENKSLRTELNQLKEGN